MQCSIFFNALAQIFRQQSLEFLVGVMQSGSECSFRDAEKGGNLRMIKAFDIVQNHNFTVFRGELFECFIDLELKFV